MKKLLILLILVSIGMRAQTPIIPDHVFNVSTVDFLRISSTLQPPLLLQETNVVRTQGYYAPDDGGSAFYVIENNPTLVDNGGDIIKINGTDLIARLIPRDDLNVLQFGAKRGSSEAVTHPDAGVILPNTSIPDPTSPDPTIPDATVAIQNALDYCVENELTQLKIPYGAYGISSTLVIKNLYKEKYQRDEDEDEDEDDNLISDGNGGYLKEPLETRPSGVYLKGDGANTTILKSLEGLSDAMIFVEGLSKKNNGDYVSGCYINGGGIVDLTLHGSKLGGENNHGLKFVAWWNAEIKNVKITEFKGHGIYNFGDLGADENPDWTASVYTNFSRTSVERCSRFGFYNKTFQAAPGASFDQVLFVLCKDGGAYVNSSEMRFLNCSFAGCGWDNEKVSPTKNHVAYGIEFGGTMDKHANSRQVVQGCEFDTNLTAHIACRWLDASNISFNRFIHNNDPEKRYAPQELEENETDIPSYPKNTVIFAPDLIDENQNYNTHDQKINGIQFNFNLVRNDTYGPFNIFNWNSVANVQNIYIKSIQLQDEPASWVDGNGNKIYPNGSEITQYKNYDLDDKNVRLNYVIENHEENGNGSDHISSGKPAPFYSGTISETGPNSTPGIGNPEALIFDLPDPMVNTLGMNGFSDTNSMYDVNTGVFTCPYTGFYEIDLSLMFKKLAHNQQATLNLRKNGNLTYANYVWGESNTLDPTRTSLSLSRRFFAKKGDKISFEIGVNSGSNVTIDTQQHLNFNRLYIRLVK